MIQRAGAYFDQDFVGLICDRRPRCTSGPRPAVLREDDCFHEGKVKPETDKVTLSLALTFVIFSLIAGLVYRRLGASLKVRAIVFAGGGPGTLSLPCRESCA